MAMTWTRFLTVYLTVASPSLLVTTDLVTLTKKTLTCQLNLNGIDVSTKTIHHHLSYDQPSHSDSLASAFRVSI